MEKIMGGKRKRLSFFTKAGYGSASMADTIFYDFVFVFFLFFLTDIAGISPAFAGTIAFVGVLWDAITDPLAGFVSDNTKSKYGRRRPYIIGSVIPLIITLTLMFTKVNFSTIGMNIYYIIITMAFWLAYKAFFIPYSALGAELTNDYHERTSLRSYATIFNYVGLLAGGALPLVLVDFFQGLGYEPATAWQYTALTLSIVAGATIVITWFSTKGKELDIELLHKESTSREGFVKTIKQLFKIKAYKFILLASMFFMASYSIFNSNLIYFSTYKLGIGEIEMAGIFLIFTIVSFFFIPVVTAFSSKIGKRKTYIWGMISAGIACCLFRFINIETIFMTIVYSIIYVIGNVVYWTLIYALIYDVCELDEFISGQQRAGMVSSYGSFVGKLGCAIGMQILGLVLHLAGYNPEALEQTPKTMNAIESAFTIVPGIFLILSGLLLIFYPISQERYERLVEALELKRQGKEYTTEGFEELL
ncbi:MFS transporter [Natronincola ferrireducens]|uniref:Glycoside/pentoside/hexuronide:cation symporter, GPH family n=1 Tax=Natronincola ferrireducens TaxID=393762 RepID=A0A1G8Z0F1_9FIRM|nr:glycoside-pentoside-hexuronide (GPH):cation symporter [Natronincola ferrireducens]SDK08568.1 glycoside/pentoside/hexuronide:cation symporter, GPH family [Natronincola ferrireducens]